jgi:hypothetical protein
MTSISINPGFMGDSVDLTIWWSDEEGISHEVIVSAEIINQDKPRTLRLTIGQHQIDAINGQHLTLSSVPSEPQPLTAEVFTENPSRPPANKIPPPTKDQSTYLNLEHVTPNWMRSGRHG